SALDVFTRTAGGLRLDRYAGISASLLEGFSLEAALENDGLSEKRWARGAPSWAAKLGAEPPGGLLRKAYAGKVLEARAFLGRRILPIDAELESWLSFLGACSADPSPPTLLARLGLRGADLSQLHALWAGRIERDEELTRQAFSLARKGKISIPTLRIVLPVLRPFPWSGSPAPAPVRAPEPEAHPPSAPPSDSPSPPPSLATPSFLLPNERAAGGAGSSARPLDPGTSEFVLPAAMVLPFAARNTADPGTTSRAAPAVSESMARDEPPPRSAPAPDIQARGETVAVFELPRGNVLPFSSEAAPPPKVEGTTGTLDAFELPIRPPLPFSAASSAAPSGSLGPSGAEKPPSPPVAPRRDAGGIGETVLAFDLSTLLSRTPSPPQKPREYAPAPPPAAVPLTMEQHASLCAELALYAGREAEILARYRVTPEARARLDKHYLSLVSESPEKRAAWNTAYRAYYEYLVAAARSR
ncbi:MAG: hypothetical protein R3B70_41105, partial [Polyangiaceae bacterium]